MNRAVCPIAAVLVAVLASSCSFERRTASFACATETDCGAGRTCSEGWCIEVGVFDDGGARPDAPLTDADPNAPDSGPDGSFVCPPQCTTCGLDGTCNILCDAVGSCATEVVCPPGIKCKVECNGESSCMAGVDCTQASSCRIECTSMDACAGLLECAADAVCLVDCDGIDSCAQGVSCADACQCVTNCAGSGSCAVPPTCPEGCTQGDDCKGDGMQCNSC